MRRNATGTRRTTTGASMMRRWAVATAALLACSFAEAAALDKLRAFLDGTRTARAEFSQTVLAKNGRKPAFSSGTMALSRPGKFRWQIEKPYPQLIVGDGEKVWLYDPELKQVTVKKVGAALGGTPAALLAGEGGIAALEKSFTLREGGEKDGLEWVDAVPKVQDSGFERVRIGFAGNELRSMEFADNFGQITTLLFSKLERNPVLPVSQFRFVAPAGVDVLGE